MCSVATAERHPGVQIPVVGNQSLAFPNIKLVTQDTLTWRKKYYFAVFIFSSSSWSSISKAMLNVTAMKITTRLLHCLSLLIALHFILDIAHPLLLVLFFISLHFIIVFWCLLWTLVSIHAMQFQIIISVTSCKLHLYKMFYPDFTGASEILVLVSLDFPNLKLIWCKRFNSVGFKMSTLSIQQWLNFTFRCRVVYKIQILLTFVCLRPSAHHSKSSVSAMKL